jgi:hypothetical protein
MSANSRSIRTTGLAIAATAAVVIAGTPMIARGSSPSHDAIATMRFNVPIAAVRAHGINVGPHRMSPGDSFQESYRPAHATGLRRQDAIGIATYGRGMFLGSITVSGGQLIYSGATNNQDDTSYAIVGGTGKYAEAAGTVRLHPISRTRVQITVNVVTDQGA